MRVIYKIINVINNKFYIGSAVRFQRRKMEHLRKLRKQEHSNKHLQASWNKYGEQAFVFVVIEEIASDKDLLAAENVWLREHVGKHYCYNIARDASAPGTGTFGDKNPMWGKTFSHTEEAKAKIGASSKERKYDEDTIRRRTAHLWGKHKTPETRAKISKTLTGEGNPNFGKHKSASFKEKVSRAVSMIDKDGVTHPYKSIKELRDATGLKPSTVNNALKHGKPMRSGKYVGWKIEDA